MLSPTERCIMQILETEGPANAHEIAARAGVSYRSLHATPTSNLGKLKTLKLIHVCDWDRQDGHGGAPVPVYAAGDKPNRKRPDPLSREEKAERRRSWIAAQKAKDNTRSIISVMLGTRPAPKRSIVSQMVSQLV